MKVDENYLSGPFDSLPDAKVTKQPTEEQRHRQFPHDAVWVVNTSRDLQYLSPVIKTLFCRAYT